MANNYAPEPWTVVHPVAVGSINQDIQVRAADGSVIYHRAQIELNPETEATARLIAEAPTMRAFIATIARLIKDGEETPEHPDGYDMESDDAVDTVADLVNTAREILDLIDSGGV